ncbi:MAG: aminoglycoside phosphotransferase family protein, partial [Caldilineaceae bacterium]|nr:aminoglycoside phosphotransferase family protein [Caldilineaceae bacterium]
ASTNGDNDLHYSKVVRPNRAAKLAATLQAVRDACRPVGIMTPEVVAVEAATGVVTMTALPGRNLLEIVADSANCTLAELSAYGRRAGAVLAALHRSALPCEKRHDALAECEVVTQWLERLAWVAPTLHAQVKPLTNQVFAALTAGGAPPAPLHRDCYDKQFVVGGSDVGLLDFDTLASGEAALDIANLLVHCQLRVYEKVTSLPRAQYLAYAFVEGYGLTNQEAARLSAYADACRLRLLCVYGCRPRQRDVVGRLAANLGQALLGIES